MIETSLQKPFATITTAAAGAHSFVFEITVLFTKKVTGFVDFVVVFSMEFERTRKKRGRMSDTWRERAKYVRHVPQVVAAAKANLDRR